MDYISTRGGAERFSAAQAIRQGIAPDGGLLVPEIPELSLDEIAAMAPLTYTERAVRILSLFLTDYTRPSCASMPNRPTVRTVSASIRRRWSS